MNGLESGKVFTLNDTYLSDSLKRPSQQAASYQDLLDDSDALYVISAPEKHYAQIKEALQKGKHVLCESPVTMETEQWEELRQMAKTGSWCSWIPSRRLILWLTIVFYYWQREAS